MTRSWGGRPTFVVGALAALFLGHYAVLLSATRSAAAAGGSVDGHETAWTLWSLVAVAAVVGLAGVAIRRLSAIARLRVDPGPMALDRPSGHIAAYVGRLGGWWVRLMVAVTALYLLQENIEYLRMGMAMPGLDVLHLGEHGAALPLIALVTLLVAAIVALADWCRCILASRRTQQALRPSGRAHQASPLRATDFRLVSAILAGRSSGRSPPSGACYQD